MDRVNKKIIIERIFDAPREAVWNAWTDPTEVKKWWGPKDFWSPSAKIDFKVGGKYIYAMHGPKGTEYDRDLWSAGIYREIVPKKKIVVSDYFSDSQGNKTSPTDHGLSPDFPTEMNVEVTFNEIGKEKTKLSIVYTPESESQYEAMIKTGMEEGWGTSLDKLANLLKSGEVSN